jgi:hypothetical protein
VKAEIAKNADFGAVVSGFVQGRYVPSAVGWTVMQGGDGLPEIFGAGDAVEAGEDP